MSKDLNKVQLTGRLGKDPEVRHTPQGNVVTQFTVASNRRWRTADGQDNTDTEWFNVVAWNKLAEICGDYLRKGSRVYIEGRLQTRSWDDQESGQKRYKTEVIASDMIMLDRKSDMEGGGAYGDTDFVDEPEQPRAQTPPRRAPATPATPGAPIGQQSGSGGPRQPARSSNGSSVATSPRRPSAPIEDDEDLPF